MPSMDGMEATRRIRALGGPLTDMPVIALTADAMGHQLEAYRAAGMKASSPSLSRPPACSRTSRASPASRFFVRRNRALEFPRRRS